MGDFLKEDTFMKELVEASESEGIDRKEIIAVFRFLGSFAINSKRVGLEELGNLFSKRVDAFAHYLQTRGYKHGKFSKGNKTFGIDTLISQAYYDLIPDKK